MASESRSITVQIPADVAASDRGLHAFAFGILSDANVRSVSVDHERSAAVVRLRANSSAELLSADLLSAEQRWRFDANQSADANAAQQRGQKLDLLSWTDPRNQSISFMRMPARVRGWRKSAYLVLATAFLTLGLFGIVLPGLPTTPFVLLGSFFLVRSSQRLHERLMSSRIFGGLLRDWYVHRGIRPHVRARAVAVVALVVAVSLLVVRPPLAVALGIGALVACGLLVIWRLPSVKE